MFLAFNRLEYTKQALENHIKSTKTNHVLIVADNGSVDGTREWLKDFEATAPPNVGFVYFDKNYGAHRPRGQFMHELHNQFDFLGFISNDVLVDGDWVGDFQNLMDAVPSIGIVGPTDREWGGHTMDKFGQHEFWGGDKFNWSDAYWLMRSSVIRDLQKTKVNLYGHQFQHPGYFFFNSFSRSQEWYWDSIRAAGYTTACMLGKSMKFVYAGKKVPEWHSKYTVLSKKICCENRRKYADETGGLMGSTMNGKHFEFLEEHPLVQRAPDWWLDSEEAELNAQLDAGASQIIMDPCTTFEDIFREI